MLQFGVVDQDGNFRIEVQQLVNLKNEKELYLEQLFERIASIKSQKEDQEQVRNYLTSVENTERQEYIVSALNTDFQLDNNTELMI